MNSKTIVGALVLALVLPLAACSNSGPHATDASSAMAQAAGEARQAMSSSAISAEVRKGIDEARQKLLTQNIDVDDVHTGWHHHEPNRDLPRAQITPQGDLLIAGKKVDATPAQHALLVAYRQQIIAIAEAGMNIGASGANLGVNAAKEALSAVFAGKSDKEIEATIKPQAAAIQAAAAQLCQRLPGLLASQQKLAAAMPAFRPYATMTQQDIDDCHADASKDD